MCNSRFLNDEINSLPGRCLRIFYNGKKSTFQELPDKDSSVSTHQRNAHTVAMEIYKFANELSLDITKNKNSSVSTLAAR